MTGLADRARAWPPLARTWPSSGASRAARHLAARVPRASPRAPARRAGAAGCRTRTVVRRWRMATRRWGGRSEARAGLRRGCARRTAPPGSYHEVGDHARSGAAPGASLPYQADRLGGAAAAWRRRSSAALRAGERRRGSCRRRGMLAAPLLLARRATGPRRARWRWPALTEAPCRRLPLLGAAALGRWRARRASRRWPGRWCATLLPGGPGTPRRATAHSAIALGAAALAAALALDAGDLPAARAWLAAHDRWLAWSGAVLGRAEGRARLGAPTTARRATPAPRREHAERALAHAADAAPAARPPRRPPPRSANWPRRRGGTPRRPAHLDAALALADACAAPYERALTLLALAELRAPPTRAGGRRGAALAEARAILAPLGARPALARADALAARLAPRRARPAGLPRRADRARGRGAAPRRPGADQRPGRRSASSSARAPSTPHLRRIYGKLGVNSRAAATRFAIEHGLA